MQPPNDQRLVQPKLSIFDHSTGCSTDHYKQFCANVLERSNIQYQVQQKDLQNRTPLETQCIKQDFVVTSLLMMVQPYLHLAS